MIERIVLSVFLVVSFMVSPAPTSAGDDGFAGVTNCYINGKFVTVKGNCPASSGGASSGSKSASGAGGLYGAGYQIGFALGQWLFGGGSDPQADLQKKMMLQELERRQEEAERQYREEEARRLAEIKDRLSSTLKQGGLPELKLKDSDGGAATGLRLKTGGDSGEPSGIKGLPGIYRNDGNTPYGIPGLPGIYTGGPGEGSGLTGTGLKFKTGGDGSGDAQAREAAIPPSAKEYPGIDADALAGVLKAAERPGEMTPKQMADVAEQIGKLPQDLQKDLWAGMEGGAAAGRNKIKGLSESSAAMATDTLERTDSASRGAASAGVPEDASGKTRIGFDQPTGPPPVHLESLPLSSPKIPSIPGSAAP